MGAGGQRRLPRRAALVDDVRRPRGPSLPPVLRLPHRPGGEGPRGGPHRPAGRRRLDQPAILLLDGGQLKALGSGDKATHNVVGKLGVMQGNHSDLQIGLPLQSVSDGSRPVHEPLRLQAVSGPPGTTSGRSFAGTSRCGSWWTTAGSPCFAHDPEGGGFWRTAPAASGPPNRTPPAYGRGERTACRRAGRGDWSRRRPALLDGPSIADAPVESLPAHTPARIGLDPAGRDAIIRRSHPSGHPESRVSFGSCTRGPRIRSAH